MNKWLLSTAVVTIFTFCNLCNVAEAESPVIIPPITLANKAQKLLERMTHSYTQKEIDMICSVVQHEVGNCSDESKSAIVHVILNRANDDRFPNTIYDVLHDKGQFEAIHNYYDNEIPVTDETIKVVDHALYEDDNLDGAWCYYNPNFVTDKHIVNWFESLEFVKEIDGQRYFK